MSVRHARYDAADNRVSDGDERQDDDVYLPLRRRYGDPAPRLLSRPQP